MLLTSAVFPRKIGPCVFLYKVIPDLSLAVFRLIIVNSGGTFHHNPQSNVSRECGMYYLPST